MRNVEFGRLTRQTRWHNELHTAPGLVKGRNRSRSLGVIGQALTTAWPVRAMTSRLPTQTRQNRSGIYNWGIFVRVIFNRTLGKRCEVCLVTYRSMQSPTTMVCLRKLFFQFGLQSNPKDIGNSLYFIYPYGFKDQSDRTKLYPVRRWSLPLVEHSADNTDEELTRDNSDVPIGASPDKSAVCYPYGRYGHCMSVRSAVFQLLSAMCIFLLIHKYWWRVSQGNVECFIYKDCLLHFHWA